MIIIMFTLVDELAPLYMYPSTIPYQNPYRNLVDMHYEGVDSVLATANAAWGNTYSAVTDSYWPNGASPGDDLANPDLGSPYDISGATTDFITGTYFPSADGYENLLIDPNSVNGFNLASTSNDPTILTDIDPGGFLSASGNAASAANVFQSINGFIQGNYAPAAGQAADVNSYEIFGALFNTTSLYTPNTGVPTGTPIYTAWLNLIAGTSTASPSTYTESNRAAAFLALSILQGSYNYWCQVYQDCLANSTPVSTPPTGVTNGYIYINNMLYTYNAATGNTATLTDFVQDLIDWRKVIQQSIKAALLVLVNSQGHKSLLNMGDQGFTIGAGTAAISAAVRYFGEQVVVGISTLADGSTPNDIPAPKKHSLKVGGTTAMKPSHHLVITAVKIKNPTANSNGKSANGKSVNGKNGLKVKNKAKLATNGKRK